MGQVACRVLTLAAALGGGGGGGPPLAAGLNVVLVPENQTLYEFREPPSSFLQPPAPNAFFVPLFFDVGLAPGAKISLDISHVDQRSNESVVLLFTQKQWIDWIQGPPRIPSTLKYSTYLPVSWRLPLNRQVRATFHVQAMAPDWYYFIVLNVHRDVVLERATVSYENPGGEHLPLQLAHMPLTARVSAIVFSVLTMAMAMHLCIVWYLGVAKPVLHALLAVCAALKFAELCLCWRYYLLLSSDGEAPRWRHQAFEFANKMHATFEMITLLLTALGWRSLRPQLSSPEQRFAVLATSVALGLAVLEVLGSSDGIPRTEVTFKLAYYVLFMVCQLVVILATTCNLQLIQAHLAESPVTAPVAALYQKQEAYFHFRRLFLIILFRPSILKWLGQVMLTGLESAWIIDALKEASLCGIYIALWITLPPGQATRIRALLQAAIAHGEAEAEAEAREAEADGAAPGGAAAPEGGGAGAAGGATPGGPALAAGDGAAAAAAGRGVEEEAEEEDAEAAYVLLPGGEE